MPIGGVGGNQNLPSWSNVEKTSGQERTGFASKEEVLRQLEGNLAMTSFLTSEHTQDVLKRIENTITKAPESQGTLHAVRASISGAAKTGFSAAVAKSHLEDSLQSRVGTFFQNVFKR